MKFGPCKVKTLNLEKWCFLSPPLSICVPVSSRYERDWSCGNLFKLIEFGVVMLFSEVADRGKGFSHVLSLFYHIHCRSSMPSSSSADEFHCCSDTTETKSLSGSSSHDIESAKAIVSFDDCAEPVPTKEEASKQLEQLEEKGKQTLPIRFIGKDDATDWYVDVLLAANLETGKPYKGLALLSRVFLVFYNFKMVQ